MKECERMSQKERKKNTILEKMKKDSNAPDSKKLCRTTKNGCQRIKAQHDDGGL